ncbi:MAG: hypothetical protein V8R51_02220 [Clostridia bacterium]
MTKVIYTYEDGCKKIEETGAGGLTTQDITVTWEYNDGQKKVTMVLYQVMLKKW